MIAAIGAWVVRVIGGFNIFFGVRKSERFGKIIFYSLLTLIVSGLLLGVYHKIFIQPTTQIDKIEKQINVYEPPKVPIFGCNAWRVNASVYWQKATAVNGKSK